MAGDSASRQLLRSARERAKSAKKARPLLLDLFCGDGGAAMGYYEAGFNVVGIDIEPHPKYPFVCHTDDALRVLDDVEFLSKFDAIHASPPCQGYSRMRHLPWLAGKEYPLLIDPVRDRLIKRGLPWVIENVEDAPLQRSPGLFGVHGVLLCGTMFGLGVYRHRPFESNVIISQPAHPAHTETIQEGNNLGDRARTPVRRGITAWQEDGGVGAHMSNVDRYRKAMGINWPMPAKGLSQAIPPAYTRWIGTQLIEHLKAVA